MPHIRQLGQSPPSSPSSSVRSGKSRTRSYEEGEAPEGQGEIAILARRIQDIIDGDEGALASNGLPGSVTGSAASGSFHDTNYKPSRGNNEQEEHEDLRKSLTEAFSGQ